MEKSRQDEIIDISKKILTRTALDAFVASLIAPLNRIKIIQQTDPSSKPGSILETIRVVQEREGNIGFWKANIYQILFSIPTTFIQYFFRMQSESTARILQTNFGNLSSYLITKLFGDIATLALAYPFDVIITRMLGDIAGDYIGFKDCFKKTVEREGYLALFKGFGTAILSLIPYEFSLLMISPMLTQFVNSIFSSRNSQILAFGILSNLVANAIAYPFYTIKRKLQVSGSPQFKKYEGFVDCLGSVLKEEGLSGLYKGIII